MSLQFYLDNLAKLPEVLNRKQVAEALAINPKTLLEQRKRGDFPPPDFFAGHPFWKRETVKAHLERRAEKYRVKLGKAVDNGRV